MKVKCFLADALCILPVVLLRMSSEKSWYIVCAIATQSKFFFNCIPFAQCCRPNSPWDGKSPNSIAAAIIYMVTQLPAATNKPSTATIALECSIAEGTLQSTYRDLYTEKAGLIPKWFARAEDLQLLQQPREQLAMS